MACTRRQFIVSKINPPAITGEPAVWALKPLLLTVFVMINFIGAADDVGVFFEICGSINAWFYSFKVKLTESWIIRFNIDFLTFMHFFVRNKKSFTSYFHEKFTRFCIFLITCTVFSCWVCNVVSWLAALPIIGFSSDRPPIVSTLNWVVWGLASPEACETLGLLPVWGNCSTIGCPDFPIAVTKSFCPSCLMTCVPAVFAASVAWDEATLLRMIWWFAGDMVKGAVSFCSPLVETEVPVMLSVVLTATVEAVTDGLRASGGDDVLGIKIACWLPELMLQSVDVVRIWVCSVDEEPEQRLKLSEIKVVSVSIGTGVSSLSSVWTTVLPGWGWDMASMASVSMISSGRRLLSSGDTTSMVAMFQHSANHKTNAEPYLKKQTQKPSWQTCSKFPLEMT